ncbi:MAG TPA: gliding motility protein GldM [Chitinophagaceae bacterium]|nr:gliding motility protein GldM [Chitinophagaceae bacterium]
MGLPKEPRQKMINMMYLVLTALLALNVSSEILNAFRTVNHSIDTSNQLITDKNQLTYNAFKKDMEDPQTKAKAEIWAPKATQIQQLSASLFTSIETLKQDMKKESGLRMVDGKEEFKEDNLDVPTRLMDKEGKGKQLYDMLAKYRKDVLAVLDPSNFDQDYLAKNPTLRTQLQNDMAAFSKSIPINLQVPKSQSGKEYSNDFKGWTTNYFHMTPTIAAITILSKFQNDVKNTEAQIVDYCHQQIGQVKLVYDKFQAIATANTTYAMPGDQIEITAGVGAFSDAAKPKITINGQVMPLQPDGTAKFATTATNAGEKVVNVSIEYSKPDGTVDRVNKEVKYTVGVPSGASVFLEKMNVLYLGVDNPLTISGGSVGSEKVKVSFPNGTLTKVSGDHYIAKPSGNPTISKIVVSADGKNYEFPMRIKRLPPPTGFVGTKKGGRISSAEFKAIGALFARLEDSDFEAPFRVVSYKLGATGGAFPVYQQATNEGNRWSGAAKAIVDKATPGTTVFFDEIRVVGPDGKEIEIAPIVFNLQ